MSAPEGIKRLLYERFLHFTHITDPISAVEIEEFADLARQHGISSYPSNVTSVHVLDCIGNHEPINNTNIAEKMNLSKASITKISTHLLKEGFIKRSQLKDNKKEVYYSLTPKGRHIYEVHAILHQMMEQRFIESMDSFSESELQAVIKFLQFMIDHHKDGFMKGSP